MTDLLDVCYPGETGLPCTVAVGLYHRAFETLHRCRDLNAEIGSDVWEEMRAAEQAWRTHRDTKPCRDED